MPYARRLVEGVFNHGFAGNRDERFGHAVGQRLEPRAVTGGEDHGLFDFIVHRPFPGNIGDIEQPISSAPGVDVWTLQSSMVMDIRFS